MLQPCEQKLHLDRDGAWPGSLIDVTVDPDINIERAVMEVAGASRRLRQGVRAVFHNLPLIAYPHEEVEDVAARWRRLRFDLQQAQRNVPVLPGHGYDGHWTPNRKIAVLIAIGGGQLSTEEALERYGLSSDELAQWARRFEALGYDGLCSTKTQRFGRITDEVQDAEPTRVAATG